MNKPKLERRLRERIRMQGKSRKTANSYWHWVKRYFSFCNKHKIGRETKAELAVERFLTHLANKEIWLANTLWCRTIKRNAGVVAPAPLSTANLYRRSAVSKRHSSPVSLSLKLATDSQFRASRHWTLHGEPFQETIRIGKKVRRKWHVECRCSCGSLFVAKTAYLIKGSTNSCGCLKHKTHECYTKSHGKYGTPTYNSWNTMLARCRNPNHTFFHRYGGRGITVCQRWYVFENFFADMGERPAGTTLDRIDNDRGYEPDNCRWSTNKEQFSNRCTSRQVSIGGVARTIREWSEISGVPYATIWGRLQRGVSADLAVYGEPKLTHPPLRQQVNGRPQLRVVG